MSSPRVLLLLLCCLPALTQAADTPPVACGTEVPEAVFELPESRPLTSGEAHALSRLFRSLAGNWRGEMVERVCMLRSPAQVRHYSADFKLGRDGDGLRLAGDYVQAGSGAKRRFLRRLFPGPEGLRIDHRGKAGEVELLAVDASGLTYVQRYRTVHELPLAASPRGAVTGSTNLAAGTSTPADPPKPERRSVTRAERFTLQTMGSRRLVLIQDYYTQGAYTGSMRWELTRR